MILYDDGWECCTCQTAVTVPPMPNCPIHTAKSDLPEPVDYQCLYVGYDGTLVCDVLGGTSASHAFTEAWHDCPGTVIAVRRVEE